VVISGGKNSEIIALELKIFFDWEGIFYIVIFSLINRKIK
jgi:hypothetical protein